MCGSERSATRLIVPSAATRQDLAAVRVVDPQRPRRRLGDQRIARRIGIGVAGNRRHRVLPHPRRQVGDQLGAAISATR